MFIRKNAAFDIAESMETSLVSHLIEKESAVINKYASALDHINVAAEIFDQLGLTKEAEIATTFLQVIAAKKAKKKPAKGKAKPKPKAKSQTATKSKPAKSDEATKDLDSDKMVNNLKEKGWVFNADDDEHDGDCECSRCKKAKRPNHGHDCSCMKCNDGMGMTKDMNYADNAEYEKDENEQDLAKMFHDLMNEDEASDDELGTNSFFPNDEYGEEMHLKNRR